MKVIKLGEHGYNEALVAVSLSYSTLDILKDSDKLESLAVRLSRLSGGHDKHLEFIQVWLGITAPRYFWQEFDTYRIGVSKYSESTMHTIHKRHLTVDDFEIINEDTLSIINTELEIMTSNYTEKLSTANLVTIKNLLPEGFLQKRLVTLNYKSLKNIIGQRMNHRLPDWKLFIDSVLEQLDHPELLIRD